MSATTLATTDYPALFISADSSSLAEQARFLRASRARLIALLGASLAGLAAWEVGRVDMFGLVGLLAFSSALGLELYLLRQRPEHAWYDGRAIAESVKTLTWRYATCGAPFQRERPTKEVDKHFTDRVQDLVQSLPDSRLSVRSASETQITPQMKSMRAQRLKERVVSYRLGRIDPQREWYVENARVNEAAANRWAIVLAALEIGGLAGAAIKAMSVVQVDLLGIGAAAVAAGAAWLQLKQHSTISRAYSVAAIELATISTQLSQRFNEGTWAEFVGEAEEAISREHTTWRASRTR